MFQIFNSKLIKTPNKNEIKTSKQIVPPSMTTKGNSSSTDSKQVISNSMSHQVNRSLRNYILFFTVEYSVEFCLTGQRPEDSHLTPITILHTHQECTNQQWAFFFLAMINQHFNSSPFVLRIFSLETHQINFQIRSLR